MPGLHWERSRIELTLALTLMLASTFPFWFTDLDITAAAGFYHSPSAGGEAWPEKNFWLWRGLFAIASPLVWSVLAAAVLTALLGGRIGALKPYRRAGCYIALVIAIGPGLLVNVLFKNHWGRPRPVHIMQFNGEHHYLPPLQIGATPDKSFVCGHCSAAFSFFAFYFLARRGKNWILAFTLGFGAIMGYSRMAAGGHFLSDVLWSGLIVFLTAYILYYAWYARTAKSDS